MAPAFSACHRQFGSLPFWLAMHLREQLAFLHFSPPIFESLEPSCVEPCRESTHQPYTSGSREGNLAGANLLPKHLRPECPRK